MGVVMGALSVAWVRRTDSTVRVGMGVPSRAITSTPASQTSHATDEPACFSAASTHRRAASASSGPVPSPVINDILYAPMLESFRW
jgi:hypothetical protein